MSELEIEIGRTLGASCFFIYQVIKDRRDFSVIDVEIETGLSNYCVWTNLKRMSEKNIIVKGERSGPKFLVYKPNNAKETWKLN